MKKIIFMLFFSLLFAGCSKKPEDPKSIYEKYRNSVVLIKNQFYYSIEFENGLKLFFTIIDNENKPQFFETENEAIEKANISFGTGFFISKDGQIATNRHVIDPLKEGIEIGKYLTKALSVFKEQLNSQIQDKISQQNKLESVFNANILFLDEYRKNEMKSEYAKLQNDINELRNKLNSINFNLNNWKINTHIIDIGIAYDNTFVTSLQDFKSCVVIKKSDEETVDLAIIQLKDKRTPDHINDLISLDIDNTKKNAAPGINEDAYMIGYNQGLGLAITNEGIKSQFTSGKITQEPDENRILYSIPTLPGSSGSPVLNRWGNLIAINYAKISNTQNFNFGIPIKQLIALAKNMTNQNGEIYKNTYSSEKTITTKPETLEQSDNKDDEHKALIRSFIKAEDSRNFDLIFNYISPSITRYWDIIKPTRDDLLNRYNYVWAKITQSRNIIKNIEKINDNTYDLLTEFEYFEIKSNSTISKNSKVRFHFDGQGKIDEIYGIQ